MKKEWIRVDSLYGQWYEVNNYGEVFRCYYVYVDKNGRPRQKNGKENRKVYKKLKQVPLHPYLKTSDKKRKDSLVVEMVLPEKSIAIALHRLIAICFVDNPNEYDYVTHIDGDIYNNRADNLKWIEAKPYTVPEIESRATVITYTHYYEIPKDHKIYQDYEKYLDDQQELKKIIVRFLHIENLLCGLVKAGIREKYKKKGDDYIEVKTPYISIYDRDERVVQHDLKILGPAACKPKRDGFIQIKGGTEFYHDWEDILKYGNNYHNIELPSIRDFVIFKENKKWQIEKLFKKDGERLLLQLRSKRDFEMTDGIKEIDEESFRR